MVMAKGVVGEGASGVRRSITQPHLESLRDAVEAEGSVERWDDLNSLFMPYISSV